MAKSKGSKRGRKKKRVAAHIKEAAGKRAAAANSGDGEGDVRAPLLAAPLGVGRPKRPRDEGQYCCTGHFTLHYMTNPAVCSSAFPAAVETRAVYWFVCL